MGWGWGGSVEDFRAAGICGAIRRWALTVTEARGSLLITAFPSSLKLVCESKHLRLPGKLEALLFLTKEIIKLETTSFQSLVRLAPGL